MEFITQVSISVEGVIKELDDIHNVLIMNSIKQRTNLMACQYAVLLGGQ